MSKKLKSDIGLAVLRILPSAFLLSHGIPKLQKLLGGDFQFADPIGVGPAPSLFLTTIGEVICPILVIIGFFGFIHAKIKRNHLFSVPLLCSYSTQCYTNV